MRGALSVKRKEEEEVAERDEEMEKMPTKK